ncbi:MAG: hypothetical protein APF84_09675 [Gracilibacter sp. BRH_c7a]|nr:MAG: hypothetical protein APF84_09675 [Gracilibacter sp. BRH_c7a]
MFNKKALQGVIYMALFFSWLLFIPFYGPGQYILTTIPEASNIFILGHIIGMLHCGWYYASRKKVDKYIVEKILVILIPICIAIAFIAQSMIIDIVTFLIIGYASSMLVIRWASWFSSSDFSSYRGLLMGMTIALSNIFLFAYTKLLYFEDYYSWVILLSSLLGTLGVFLILELSMTAGRGIEFNMKRALPPWHLLVFAIFAFMAGGFLYSAVYSVEVDVSLQLRSLTIFAYIIGVVFFGYLADKFSKIILLPSLFTVIGIGFVLLIINKGYVPLYLISESVILFGLGCADLYYWLTLADHSIKEYIPFVFAVGLSFHLVVISFTATMTEHFLMNSDWGFSLVGIIGSITMFLGIFFSFWVYRLFNPTEDILKYGETYNLGEAMSVATIPVEEASGKGIDMEYLNNIFDELTPDSFGLTQREKELALLLLQGFSYVQIAEQLFISNHTVKYHVRNILRKADVNNRHELSSVIWERISHFKSQ